MFTLFGIMTVAAVLTLPRDADSFSAVLAFAGLVIVGLCYFGLVAFPAEAIHSSNSLEPQHAGFWRGAFSHKNIAGPVMACLSFAGLYLWRRGWSVLGALLFVAAMAFMINTGSKTTAGLVPLSILLVMLPGLIGVRMLTPWLFALAIIGTALGTLGIVFIDPLKHLAADLLPDMTYTGRTSLWEFSGEMIAKRPWTGYGYESFWGTMFLMTMDQPFDRAWDIRGIVHGHNGYLDIAVIMGLPALAAAVVAFLIVPLTDYARTSNRLENVLLADLFMMMLLFTALNAFLETFFFRRADPVWLFFVMAALGLRLVARFPVATRIRD
jgi:O-antigen ligase